VINCIVETKVFRSGVFTTEYFKVLSNYMWPRTCAWWRLVDLQQAERFLA